MPAPRKQDVRVHALTMRRRIAFTEVFPTTIGEVSFITSLFGEVDEPEQEGGRRCYDDLSVSFSSCNRRAKVPGGPGRGAVQVRLWHGPYARASPTRSRPKHGWRLAGGAIRCGGWSPPPTPGWRRAWPQRRRACQQCVAPPHLAGRGRVRSCSPAIETPPKWRPRGAFHSRARARPSTGSPRAAIHRVNAIRFP